MSPPPPRRYETRRHSAWQEPLCKTIPSQLARDRRPAWLSAAPHQRRRNMRGTQVLLFSPKCHPSFKQPQLFAAPERESELEASSYKGGEPAWGLLQEKELTGALEGKPQGRVGLLGLGLFSIDNETQTGAGRKAAVLTVATKKQKRCQNSFS